MSGGAWDWDDWSDLPGELRWARYEGVWDRTAERHWIELGRPPLFLVAEKFTDLDFLAGMEGLNALMVVGEVDDDSALADCVELKVLEVSSPERAKRPLNLNRLTRLERLRLLPDRLTGGAEPLNLPALKDATLEWASPSLEGILGIPSLEVLWLAAPRVTDLRPLHRLERLGKLELDSMRRLETLLTLGESDSLRTVVVDGAPRLTALDGLLPGRGITELWFRNCRRLESVRPLMELPRLETLLLGVEVLEGDISCLFSAPSLRRLDVDIRKNFNVTKTEVSAFNEGRKSFTSDR